MTRMLPSDMRRNEECPAATGPVDSRLPGQGGRHLVRATGVIGPVYAGSVGLFFVGELILARHRIESLLEHIEASRRAQ